MVTEAASRRGSARGQPCTAMCLAEAGGKRAAFPQWPLRCLIAVGLAWACLWHARAEADIVVRDDAGHDVRFTHPPKRIVSLLPSLTESVCALGACDTLVGTDRYSNFPPVVLALPKLGDLEDSPVERILGLKPDVVLASRSDRAVERLHALGIRVLMLRTDTAADMQRAWQVLARMLDERDRGERLWASIQHMIDRAAEQVPPQVRGRRVYFEVAAGPYGAGATSFIGQLLSRLGLVNVLPPAQGPFPRINPEFVVRSQPDILMGEARALADMPTRPGWTGLRALTRRQVCSFDPDQFDMLVRPGPRMGEAAMLLSTCLGTLTGSAPGDPRP